MSDENTPETFDPSDLKQARLVVAQECNKDPEFKPSRAFLQRRLRWGFARAQRILAELKREPATPPPGPDTPTPRTDAHFAPLIANQGVLTRFVYTKDIDFARDIEREAQALRTQLAAVEKERDEAVRKATGPLALDAYQWAEEASKRAMEKHAAIAERDEARSELREIAGCFDWGRLAAGVRLKDEIMRTVILIKEQRAHEEQNRIRVEAERDALRREVEDACEQLRLSQLQVRDMAIDVENSNLYIEVLRRLDKRFGCNHVAQGPDDCDNLVRHVDELQADLVAANLKIAELEKDVADARVLINDACDIMDHVQVGRWTGVRAWLESAAQRREDPAQGGGNAQAEARP